MANQDNQYVKVFNSETAKAYSQEKGRWLLANVEQNIGWPNEEVLLIFKETKIILLPFNDEFYPAVAIKCNSLDEIDKNKTLLMHFLSSLSWSYNADNNFLSSKASRTTEKLLLYIFSNINQKKIIILYIKKYN